MPLVIDGVGYLYVLCSPRPHVIFDYQGTQLQQNITMFLCQEFEAVFPSVDFYRLSIHFVPRGENCVH